LYQFVKIKNHREPVYLDVDFLAASRRADPVRKAMKKSNPENTNAITSSFTRLAMKCALTNDPTAVPAARGTDTLGKISPCFD
jgi:hypothetical protein